MSNKFKTYQQVVIIDSDDKWYKQIGIIGGYLCNGVAYLDLGSKGPKNRNDKAITQTYLEWKLISTELYRYINGSYSLPDFDTPERRQVRLVLLDEKEWAIERVNTLKSHPRYRFHLCEINGLSQRIEVIDKVLYAH